MDSIDKSAEKEEGKRKNSKISKKIEKIQRERERERFTKKMDDSRVKVLQDFVNKIEEHKNKSNQYVLQNFFYF